MNEALLSFGLLSLSSVLIIVNPIGATLFYVSLTEGMDREVRHVIAKDACRLALIILLAFTLVGSWILQLFGITLESFQIAGGILLFGIGMEMVYAKISRTKVTATEKYEGIDTDEVSVMPLAIPMISGPGSITTVVVLANEAQQINAFSIVLVLLSVLVTIILTYFLLRNTEIITNRIGQREYRVINRLMGILLIAISVQFVINGIYGAFPSLA
jgi:multiple antibiotic resistance protein